MKNIILFTFLIITGLASNAQIIDRLPEKYTQNKSTLDTLAQNPSNGGVLTNLRNNSIGKKIVANRNNYCKSPKRTTYSSTPNNTNRPSTRGTTKYTKKTYKSTEDRCKANPKIWGYKIQIYYSKDRDTASKVRSQFASKYPSLTPEMQYLAPDFKILAGNYLTRKSAYNDLRKIKSSYPEAFIVKWLVWCRRAK